MTNSPSPDSPRPQLESSRRRPLGLDDFIGILVAFTTIGTILFWALGQKDEKLKGFPTLTGIVESSQPVAANKPSSPPGELAIPSAGVAPTQPVPLATVMPAPAGSVPVASIKEAPAPVTVPSPRRPAARVIPVIPAVVVPLPTRKTSTTPKAVSPTSPTPKAVSPTSPTPNAATLGDVPDNFWAAPFIKPLQNRGAVGGFPQNAFKPNQPVTRAEFAAMTQAVFERNPIREAGKYQDVPSDLWAAPAIDKATRIGFLKGYPGNTFQPGKQIPKVQAIVALANGLNLQPPADPAKTLQVYQDANQIPAYAKNAVAAATAAGLVVNHPDVNVLNPNKPATRAEVAALIHQALVKEGKAQKINSQFIVQPQ